MTTCPGTRMKHVWEEWRERPNAKHGEVHRARVCLVCGTPEVAYLYLSREMTGAVEVEG